jgi:hypothetical protein
MKNILWLAALAFLMPALLVQASGGGHVAIFFFSPADGGEDVEVAADFSYYRTSIESWLEERGIPHSFHAAPDITVRTPAGRVLTFTGGDLGGTVGFVLIRPDGTYRVLRGVHTDVDFIGIAREFFGLSPASAFDRLRSDTVL